MIALLSIMLGALLSLAFAPYNLHWLGILSLTGLSVIWLNPRFQRPAFYGLCFGIGNFASGVYWVYISLHYYGNANWSFSILANLLLVVYLALYPCLVGYFLRLLKTKPASLLRALSIPFLWMLFEYIRSYVLTGFPWLSIGYSQQGGFLQGVAPLAGIWGLGFVLMLLCALLAQAIIAKSWRSMIVVLFISALAYGSSSLNFVKSMGSPISVALVQGNTKPLTSFDPITLEQNMNKYIAASVDRNELIIIWPEVAIPYPEYSIRESYLKELNQIFKDKHQSLVTGIFIKNQDEFYNAALVLGDGQGVYAKDHLLPFGEFIPFKSVLKWFNHFVDIPMNDMSRGGKQQEPLITNHLKAGLSICFEGAFGRVVRRALPEAAYLINISNDSWFRNSNAADQHLQMDQMRALELGREMARATTDGYTVLIDYQGNIKKQLPRNHSNDDRENPAMVLSGEIQPYQGLTPYAQYGNKVFILIMVLYAMMLALVYRMRKKKCKNNTNPVS